MPITSASSYKRRGERREIRNAKACMYASRKSMTISELSKEWLLHSSSRLKPSTLSTYSNMLDCHILPILGGCRLQSLSNDLLEKFKDEKLLHGRNDGHGLSPKTVRDILSLIKSIVTFAEEQNYIASGSITIKYPKSSPKRIRVLSRLEQSRLEAVLLEDTDISKLGILVCLHTGLRIGEICALKWSDISFSNETLTVRCTLQRIRNLGKRGEAKTKIITDTPKSGCSFREIPLPRFLIGYLNSFYKKNENAYFLTGCETKTIEPRTYQNHFKVYVKQSGIADANFHSLRHTFSTRCVEAEFDIKSLSEILGHANVNITLDRYVHSSFEQKRKNMEKLAFVTV